MAVLNKVKIPTEVTWFAYAEQGYEFPYPQGGLFADFDHGEGVTVLSLIVKWGETYFDVNIRRQANNAQPAQEAAQAFYASAVKYFDETDNVPPFALQIARREGWRTRKRFVDALSAPLVLDSAFLQTGNTLLTFSFAAAPEEYPEGQWIFEALLKTFSLTE